MHAFTLCIVHFKYFLCYASTLVESDSVTGNSKPVCCIWFYSKLFSCLAVE